MRTGRFAGSLAGAALALLAAACAGGPKPSPVADAGARGTMKPYVVNGRRYTPRDQPGYDARGLASWYGAAYHGRATASGERFDRNALTAAHPTLPLPGLVEVTNLETGRKAVLRLNDRGPFVDGRLIDVSEAAAEQLGFRAKGSARVRVRYLGRADGRPTVTVARAQATPVSPRRAAPTLTTAAAPSATAASASASGPVDAQTAFESLLAGRPIPSTAPVRLASPAMAAASRAPEAPAPRAPVAEAPEGWRVQAAAFADRGQADRTAQRLSFAGAPRVEPVERAGGRLYRVQLTGFADAEAARWAQAQVQAAGFPDAVVLAAR